MLTLSCDLTLLAYIPMGFQGILDPNGGTGSPPHPMTPAPKHRTRAPSPKPRPPAGELFSPDSGSLEQKED